MILAEQQVYKKLKSAYANGITNFTVYGSKGCGKSYVINLFLNGESDIKRIVYFQMYNHDLNNEYAPYKNGLSNHNTFLIEPVVDKIIDDIPASNTKITILSYILKFVRNTHRKIKDNAFSIFTQAEMDIISKIRFLEMRDKTAFVFDNIYEWDSNSLSLLSKILYCKNNKNIFNNTVFIITDTDYDKNIFESDCSEIIDFDSFHNKIITTSELSELMSKNLESSAIDRIRPIIKVCGNDLYLLKRVITDLLYYDDISEVYQKNNKLDIIKSLLSKKLCELGAEGHQISEVLEYASVLGMHFSVYELEEALESSKDELHNIIKKATELCIIDNYQQAKTVINTYYKFAHEFIRRVFENSITKNKIHVYTQLSQAILKTTPYDYLRRARYKIQANYFDDAITLYVLYFFQQIRNDSNVNLDVLKEFIGLYGDDNILLGQIEQYRHGYKLYSDKKYVDAYNVFSSINRLSHINILAEIDIMISMCLTKNLDEKSRSAAINVLEKHLDNESIDISVKERLQIRLIIAYAHNNRTSDAYNMDKSLCESLASRRLYDTKSVEQYMLLQRVSNSYCDCEISMIKMKQAVDYFGPYMSELPQNIIQYYLATTNYAGSLCLCGRFSDSFEVSSHVLSLQLKYEQIQYPRSHININNYIISGFLSENFSCNEALEQYIALINVVPFSAERMFFVSNLSVFYSLCGQHERAYELIEAEAERQRVHNDPEKIYNYRYCTNAAIFKFLTGKYDEAISIIKQCPEIKEDIPDSIYMNKKVLLLKKLFNTQTKIEGQNFLYTFKNKTCNETSERYYLLGYTFTTLYNWDID